MVYKDKDPTNHDGEYTVFSVPSSACRSSGWRAAVSRHSSKARLRRKTWGQVAEAGGPNLGASKDYINDIWHVQCMVYNIWQAYVYIYIIMSLSAYILYIQNTWYIIYIYICIECVQHVVYGIWYTIHGSYEQ